MLNVENRMSKISSQNCNHFFSGVEFHFQRGLLVGVRASEKYRRAESLDSSDSSDSSDRMRRQTPRCIILHVAVGPLIYWADNVSISGSLTFRLWQASNSIAVSSSFRSFTSGGFMEVWIGYQNDVLWHASRVFQLPFAEGYGLWWCHRPVVRGGFGEWLCVWRRSCHRKQTRSKHEVTEFSLQSAPSEGDSMRFDEFQRDSDVSVAKKMWKQNAVKAILGSLCSDGGGSALTALRACWT